MSEETEEHSEVYNHYLELSKPTEEDFKRVFTEDELKELCLKHKCKVNMWRWNVVNEYREIFTESGRYQRWSDRHRLGMLAKAVNRMKPSVLYDEEEIKKIRREEWEFQLKENILSLNFWKRKRQHNSHVEVAESDEIDVDVPSQCVVNTESMNVDELLTQSELQEPKQENSIEQENYLEVEILTESSNGVEILPQFRRQKLPVNLPQTNPEFSTSRNRISKSVEKVSTDNNSPIASQQEENVLLGGMELCFLIEDDSSDSVETVLYKEHPKTIISETLQSEEIAPEIENIYGVNTLSMTIDSRISTQSENLSMQHSEDAMPASYDNFWDVIPITSTQSQNQELEAS